jgi:hypothetical protein
LCCKVGAKNAGKRFRRGESHRYGGELELDPIDLGDGNLTEVTYFMIHKDSGIIGYINIRTDFPCVASISGLTLS